MSILLHHAVQKLYDNLFDLVHSPNPTPENREQFRDVVKFALQAFKNASGADAVEVVASNINYNSFVIIFQCRIRGLGVRLVFSYEGSNYRIHMEPFFDQSGDALFNQVIDHKLELDEVNEKAFQTIWQEFIKGCEQWRTDAFEAMKRFTNRKYTDVAGYYLGKPTLYSDQFDNIENFDTFNEQTIKIHYHHGVALKKFLAGVPRG